MATAGSCGCEIELFLESSEWANQVNVIVCKRKFENVYNGTRAGSWSFIALLRGEGERNDFKA